ncbi:hypothetical protein DUNSADRAFT_2048 [Dunaliella salina]|uniref:Encoded protein n=1 Tax=Dunaliella salina TaxID=3046 RepID=A0ABQ7GWA0_DUNSA|nr:hypothetical protein DUNSADRAFT_2048 [Dunaliella salina]|eukprot:KAF5838879.1 hypothetical protein DUNSADRAFT_2048 [Dunaliella salina]
MNHWLFSLPVLHDFGKIGIGKHKAFDTCPPTRPQKTLPCILKPKNEPAPATNAAGKNFSQAVYLLILDDRPSYTSVSSFLTSIHACQALHTDLFPPGCLTSHHACQTLHTSLFPPDCMTSYFARQSPHINLFPPEANTSRTKLRTLLRMLGDA